MERRYGTSELTQAQADQIMRDNIDRIGGAEQAVAAAFHLARSQKKRKDNPVARAILERMDKQKSRR